ISIVGFICIPKGTNLSFPQPNSSLPLSKKFVGKERINEAFQFPLYYSRRKEFVHFIKALDDPKGLEWVGKQLKAGLQVEDRIDSICWLWLKSGIKEFQEIIQNWINYNGEEMLIRYCSIKTALCLTQNGKLLQAYL